MTITTTKERDNKRKSSRIDVTALTTALNLASETSTTSMTSSKPSPAPRLSKQDDPHQQPQKLEPKQHDEIRSVSVFCKNAEGQKVETSHESHTLSLQQQQQQKRLQSPQQQPQQQPSRNQQRPSTSETLPPSGKSPPSTGGAIGGRGDGGGRVATSSGRNPNYLTIGRTKDVHRELRHTTTTKNTTTSLETK